MLKVATLCVALAAISIHALVLAPSPVLGEHGSPPGGMRADGSLPASLDALYPPAAQGPVFLLKMHAVAAPMSGMMVDLMEGDMPNARSGYEALKSQYSELRVMVPEWTDRYPLGPVDELGTAMASGAQPQIMAAFQKLGQVCGDCHASQMTPVHQKYHWGDFGSIEVDDPLIGKKAGFAQFMHLLDAGLTGVPLNLSQGQVDNARKSLQAFSTRFDVLKQSCFNCHDTEREYYVDADVRGMIAKAEQILQTPNPDRAAVASLMQGIGMESCHKCHLVHVPAAMAQAQMGMKARGAH